MNRRVEDIANMVAGFIIAGILLLLLYLAVGGNQEERILVEPENPDAEKILIDSPPASLYTIGAGTEIA